MTDESALLSDQVFQLNTFLWALEELPENSDARPVLREAGYYLVAIERNVLVPTDETTLAALATLAEITDRSPCRPDLWLRHATDAFEPLIELKAHGFSPESSNRRQALKLIASVSDLAPSLGETDVRPGHVIYATGVDDANDMASTLSTLAAELDSEGVNPAPTGAIGLAIEDKGVVLSSPDTTDLPGPLGNALANRPTVLHRDGENDLQPLYFIPWIPGIKDSQDAELHSAGLRELTARVLTNLLAAVGQALPPTTVVLRGDTLLRDATFGISDRWRDKDRRTFSDSVVKVVERTLKSVVDLNRPSTDSREFDLPDLETKDAVIDRIENADPADPSTNLQAITEEPPSLFDEFTDGSK
ncbi:MAG: hypothetical protein OXN44_04695 [Acidimicrobiaceae bacterium]|nr:hypothetical protein [Acidimicrobiaceae bacterium]